MHDISMVDHVGWLRIWLLNSEQTTGHRRCADFATSDAEMIISAAAAGASASIGLYKNLQRSAGSRI
jgi:hypothetical protein